METTFEKLEYETKEVNASIGNLRQTYFELQEMKHLLRKTQIFFDEVWTSLTYDFSVLLKCTLSKHYFSRLTKLFHLMLMRI